MNELKKCHNDLANLFYLILKEGLRLQKSQICPICHPSWHDHIQNESKICVRGKKVEYAKVESAIDDWHLSTNDGELNNDDVNIGCKFELKNQTWPNQKSLAF